MHTTTNLLNNPALIHLAKTDHNTIVVWVFTVIGCILAVLLLGWILTITRAVAKGNYHLAAKCIDLEPLTSSSEGLYNPLDATCFAEKAGDYEYAEKLLVKAMKNKPQDVHYLLGLRIAIRRGDWNAAAERLAAVRLLYSNRAISAETASLITQADTMIRTQTVDDATMNQLNLYREQFERLVKNGRITYILTVVMTTLVSIIVIGALVAQSFLAQQ